MKKDVKSKTNKYKLEIFGGIEKTFSMTCDCLSQEILEDILSKAFKSRDIGGNSFYKNFRLNNLVAEEKMLNLQDFNIEGLVGNNQWSLIGICRIRRV